MRVVDDVRRNRRRAHVFRFDATKRHPVSEFYAHPHRERRFEESLGVSEAAKECLQDRPPLRHRCDTHAACLLGQLRQARAAHPAKRTRHPG